MSNFTFKNHPKPKGLAGVGHQGGGDIKYEKKKIGFFSKNVGFYHGNTNWAMFLAVKKEPTKDDSCDFKNVNVFEHESLEAAKQWLKDNKKELLEKYVLVPIEDL